MIIKDFFLRGVSLSGAKDNEDSISVPHNTGQAAFVRLCPNQRQQQTQWAGQS
ncbi:MAG: hypothetical protein IV089_02080 [Thiobacillus sp.]|nr:hypothetical protein [Thiobacillus sp.]